MKTCCSTNLYRDRGAQCCRDSGSFEFWIGDHSLPWFIHFSSFFHTVKQGGGVFSLTPFRCVCIRSSKSLLLPFKEESTLVFGARFHDILNLLETHWTDLGLWCATLKQRLEVQNSRSATSNHAHRPRLATTFVDVQWLTGYRQVTLCYIARLSGIEHYWVEERQFTAWTLAGSPSSLAG